MDLSEFSVQNAFSHFVKIFTSREHRIPIPGSLRTRNQFCTTEKPCNHRSLTEEFRQKSSDRQMNVGERVGSSPPSRHDQCVKITAAGLSIFHLVATYLPLKKCSFGCFPNTGFSCALSTLNHI